MTRCERSKQMALQLVLWVLFATHNAAGYGLFDCKFRIKRADPWEVKLISGEALEHFDCGRISNPTKLPILTPAHWELTGRAVNRSDVGRVFKGTLYHPGWGGPFLLKESEAGGDGLSFRSKWDSDDPWIPFAKDAAIPQSLEKLRKSQCIVVGTVRQLRIESESARNQGPGNFDWAVYVTLAVEAVEKGKIVEPTIVFRCYRSKHRRSVFESIGSDGHLRIPDTGTTVRVYLHRWSSELWAALPNGITDPRANDDASVMRPPGFADAAEIRELRDRTRRYTYFLPLEAWVNACAGVVLIALSIAAFRAARWYIRRKRNR